VIHEHLRGRFCENEVWRDGGFVPCGGETRYARRVEGERLVSYVLCLFCGHAKPMLEYNLETRELVKVSEW